VSEPFVAHSVRSFTYSAERLAARNSRIKVNFARLTHNQCSTRVPALTRADPRLSPQSSIPIRPPEWFPVIQHRRARPQIICILSRAAPSGVTASRTCVQFLATAIAIAPRLVVSYSCFVQGRRAKVRNHLSRAVVRLSIREHTQQLRSVGRLAATRSCRRRHDTIVPRSEKLYRGNNRYDSCRELYLAVFPDSSSAISLFLISFTLLLYLSPRPSCSIRPARDVRRCRD